MRRAALLTLSTLVLAVAVPCGRALAADTSPPARAAVVVRVYDSARLAPDVRAGALDAAARALEAAGVTPAWRLCAPRADEGCDRPLTPRELIVRLVRSGAGAAAGASLVLGHAHVDTATGAGTLATIFVDRVERLAAGAGADLALLVGRATAHEIGHLLLGTNRHDDRGLMRAVWSSEEIARDRADDWEFDGPEHAALRAAAAVRAAGAAR